MNSPRTTLYRDKKNGKIMGVCAGIAEYTGINVGWIRLGAIVIALAMGGFVIPAYGVNYLFAGRKLALFWIDAGYWLVTYLVMGTILELLA